MQGRDLRGPWTFAVLLLASACAGCGGNSALDLDDHDPPTPLASAFDPAATGAIAGRVNWEGPAPEVPSFVSTERPVMAPPWPPERNWDNPNVPRIDPATGALRDVAIFLRGIDTTRSRPWHLPPVNVEMKEHRYAIRQGDCHASRLGFVRRGDEVAMVSADSTLYVLRAQGAAFFALPFPDAGRPCQRKLSRNGLVELTSNCGHFWMRAYLFVDEHPYFARTGPLGDFALEQVPEGEYELVCWSPSWRVGKTERDSMSQLPSTLTFGPPVEVVRRLTVSRGKTAEVTFTLSKEMFGK